MESLSHKGRISEDNGHSIHLLGSSATNGHVSNCACETAGTAGGQGQRWALLYGMSVFPPGVGNGESKARPTVRMAPRLGEIGRASIVTVHVSAGDCAVLVSEDQEGQQRDGTEQPTCRNQPAGRGCSSHRVWYACCQRPDLTVQEKQCPNKEGHLCSLK